MCSRFAGGASFVGPLAGLVAVPRSLFTPIQIKPSKSLKHHHTGIRLVKSVTKVRLQIPKM